jgi:hypothetical protein
MRLFSSRVLWNGAIRTILFWCIVSATVYAFSLRAPVLDFRLIAESLGVAATGHHDALSSQAFAFALAALIFAVALGFLVAYFVMHAMLIRRAITDARRVITRERDAAGFTAHFAVIDQRLSRHPLIGPAWRAFQQTMLRISGASTIQTTLRPGNLINIGTARERLFGLKMIGSLPGYFVGVGLLLTFVGLVLALYQASAAVSSSDADGMQTATRQLLNVATFKFATSIAGLGSSIMLSIFFRIYVVWIEAAFDRFNHELEVRLSFTSAQSISWSMNESLSAQLAELKRINSPDFFAHMAEKISPQIRSAFNDAVAPVTASIEAAMTRLADASQTGVSDLLTQFAEKLHFGAGAELRELTGTLQTMKGALLEAQSAIGKTGEDFGRRMAQAGDNLNRMVSDAGGRMSESSEQSRNAMMDVVGALRETFERANRKVDEQLGEAAATASGKVEAAMKRVMTTLEAQVEEFRDGLGSFHQGMLRQLTDTNSQVAAAQANAVSAVAAASSEAARALQAGLAAALQSVREELDKFAGTIRSVEAGMTAQVAALRDAGDQSRRAADAFGTTAQDIRSASAPLLQSGERIAIATEGLTTSVVGASERISLGVVEANTKLADSVSRSVASLETGQRSASEFAGSLRRHIDQLSTVWTGYAEKFERVDADLGKAVADLAGAVGTQGEQLVTYASKVDESFATAISRLNPFLNELRSNTEELGDAVSELKGALVPQAAE